MFCKHKYNPHGVQLICGTHNEKPFFFFKRPSTICCVRIFFHVHNINIENASLYNLPQKIVVIRRKLSYAMQYPLHIVLFLKHMAIFSILTLYICMYICIGSVLQSEMLQQYAKDENYADIFRGSLTCDRTCVRFWPSIEFIRYSVCVHWGHTYTCYSYNIHSMYGNSLKTTTIWYIRKCSYWLCHTSSLFDWKYLYNVS